MAIAVPMVAWAKVNAGVPVRVQSSDPCTAESPGDTGRVTCGVASVVASYSRLAAVNVPVMVMVRLLMLAAVDVAVVFQL